MTAGIYKFEDFRLDPAARELWRGDEELGLPPKAFGCLVCLLENRDRAVSRDELIDAVWGRGHLGDGILGQAIFVIRRALDDNGEETRFVKTVRSFGYRWVAPVEVVETTGGEPGEPLPEMRERDSSDGSGGKRKITLTASAGLVLCVLVLAIVYVLRDAEPPEPDAVFPLRGEGDIAMLLPVTVVADDRYRWLRFGAMELVADRLRAAGQPMVPGETVIALLGGEFEGEMDGDRLKHLSATTGASLILGARAESTASGWRVSLRNLDEDAPPLVASAEAADVLEAARGAADRMALYLGLTPAPEPGAEGGLMPLMQQIEAARLAQRMELAQELIESAPRELREHPEIRFQRGRIEFYSHRLDAAEAVYESLLGDLTEDENQVLRARVMNGLATVWILQGRRDEAAALMEDATHLLAGPDALDTLGVVHMNLGNLAQERGDFAVAEEHFAQAQRILQGIGDVQRLAALEANMGVLMGRRGRHADALRYYENAAGRHVAVHNLAGELHARAGLIEAHLSLLDPQAAAALDSRVEELLAQTTHVQVEAFARIIRAALLDARGRRQEAESVLEGVLELAGLPDDLRMMGVLLRVEWMLGGGDFAPAAELAKELVGGLADHPHMSGHRSLAWLLWVRAELGQRAYAAAASAAAELSDWAEESSLPPPVVHAALARAEVAAAGGRSEAAVPAFEHALGLADTGQVSVDVLRVVESYSTWLIEETGNAEHALLVANRVAGYTDRSFPAALVQLRVYHALGPNSAWRAALTRAESLAGEREIPPELRLPPDL